MLKSKRLKGKKICIDIIQEVKEIKGVSGVHVMAYRQEDTVANIIQTSGVLGDRVPWFPGRDTPNPTINHTSKETA